MFCKPDGVLQTNENMQLLCFHSKNDRMLETIQLKASLVNDLQAINTGSARYHWNTEFVFQSVLKQTPKDVL